jgi:hypothetical protein
MSVESGRAFLQVAYDSPELKQQLKAVTGTQEIVRLGRRYGYTFDVPELMEASSSFAEPSADAPRVRTEKIDAATAHPARSGTDAGRGHNTPSSTGHAPPPDVAARGRHPLPGAPVGGARTRNAPSGPTASEAAGSGPLHHEYRLSDLPGLAAVVEQLPHLKIKPPSVDLRRFEQTFREEDLRSTSMSPANPEFRAWHEAMSRAHWRDPALGASAPRRDFHLVNLDEHVDHAGYDRYLRAKHRTIDALEGFFRTEVCFSGSLWYPPSSYRLWHTNETQPGWRMYVIDFDEPPADEAETSFFRYMDPRTEEIVTLRETPQMVRFFKAEQDPSRLFWHCIVNPTPRHRWSFGFVVPDTWMTAITRAA